MRLLLITLLSSCLSFAHASTVKQTVRPGVEARATYLAGAAGKPAVLLLHGFLQTRDFPTIATLTTGLNEAGYSVLAPTLSLNIPNRQKSLACEAIHRHSMDDTLTELDIWVRWLRSNGHRNVVLLGHSFGALQMLAYLSAQPDPAVKAFLAASLIEARTGNTARIAQLADMRQRARNRPNELVTASLSICKTYRTNPQDLLSYIVWDDKQTLAALKSLPVKTRLIVGDTDNRAGSGWIAALRHVHPDLVLLSGANHFMSGESEFDLLDSALEFLSTVGQAAR